MSIPTIPKPIPEQATPFTLAAFLAVAVADEEEATPEFELPDVVADVVLEWLLLLKALPVLMMLELVAVVSCTCASRMVIYMYSMSVEARSTYSVVLVVAVVVASHQPSPVQ